MGITLTLYIPFHKGGSPTSLCFHWILKTWLSHMMVVVVEKRMSWRFYGTVGTIEVDDFKGEFTMWYEL